MVFVDVKDHVYLRRQLLGLWYLHIYTVGTKDLKSCRLLRSYLCCSGFSLKKALMGSCPHFGVMESAVGNRLKH